MDAYTVLADENTTLLIIYNKNQLGGYSGNISIITLSNSVLTYCGSKQKCHGIEIVERISIDLITESNDVTNIRNSGYKGCDNRHKCHGIENKQHSMNKVYYFKQQRQQAQE